MQQLRWVSGDWIGSGGGYDAFYERYTVRKDGAIDIEFFGDAAFTRRSGTGTMTLEGNTIRYRTGGATWEATTVKPNEVCFAPKARATNSFCWLRHSKDAWRATLQYPGSQQRKVVYELKRTL